MAKQAPLELRILRFLEHPKYELGQEIPVHPKDLEAAIKAFPDHKFRALKTKDDTFKPLEEIEEHQNE